MAANMADVLDAYSVHVYFWNPGYFKQRLEDIRTVWALTTHPSAG